MLQRSKVGTASKNSKILLCLEGNPSFSKSLTKKIAGFFSVNVIIIFFTVQMAGWLVSSASDRSLVRITLKLGYFESLQSSGSHYLVLISVGKSSTSKLIVDTVCLLGSFLSVLALILFF